MKPGDHIEITVRAIANGFLVTEEKRSADYTSGRSQPRFYLTLDIVEREMAHHLKSAINIETKEQDF